MVRAARHALLETGVRNFDVALGGGVVAGDTLLIVGPPGAGKTTLAFQMAFHAAATGGRALYASTYSESASRLVKHLETFSFWDPSLVGKTLFLESLAPGLKRSVADLVDLIVGAVRARAATMLIIDGLMTLRDVHRDSLEIRTFVDDLAAALSPLGCTTLLTSSFVPERRGDTPPEFTMCDAIIELGYRERESDTGRVIDVWKTRGAANLLGKHAFAIKGEGLVVFPRSESLPLPPPRTLEGQRLSFGSIGAPELDRMASGGLPRGGVTLIAGAPGTGKTLLALQYLLDGAERGERGIWVSFRESEPELVAKAKTFGRDLQRWLDDGTVHVIHRVPVALDADEVQLALWDDVATHETVRLVVDSVAELQWSLGSARLRSVMAALAERVRRHAITAVLMRELTQVVGPELDFAESPLEVLAENVILLRYVEYEGELARILSILKMRDAPHDRSIRQYVIESDHGLRVLSQLESAEGLLSGIARMPSEQRVKRSQGGSALDEGEG